MTDFRELVGDDLTPEEEERLARVHRLLVEAGPPPDLPPALEQLPGEAPADNVLPLLPRRRAAVAVLIAAALVAAAFGAGYLFGQGKSKQSFTAVGQPIPMRGPDGRLASIELGPRDASGNWPLRLQVTGLKEQPPGAYYELFLTRDGRPIASCGTFRVHAKTTTVRLNAPYDLRRFRGWIVTAHLPRGPEHGPALLTT